MVYAYRLIIDKGSLSIYLLLNVPKFIYGVLFTWSFSEHSDKWISYSSSCFARIAIEPCLRKVLVPDNCSIYFAVSGSSKVWSVLFKGVLLNYGLTRFFNAWSLLDFGDTDWS